MQKNVILAIAVIASLAVGAGGVYVFTYSQVKTLTNENVDLKTQIDYLLSQVFVLSSENDRLQSQVDLLSSEHSTAQNQTSSLDAEKARLQEQLSSLASEYDSLEARYGLLAETVDAMHSGNYTRVVNYNLSAGAELTEFFVLDEFGIVWESVIDFSGTTMSVTNYYWYNGTRNYVTSYSRSISTNNGDGPLEELYGKIKLDVALDYRDANRIHLAYITSTQFLDVRMSGNIFFDM